MFGSFVRRLLLVVSLAAGTTIGAGSVVAQEEETPPPGMFLDVGNPAPGDTIHVGGINIEGIAFDRASEEGPGIERIDIFLEDRDQAGTLVGHAGLGMESPAADDPPIANAGWAAQATLTRNMTGPHTLFFYAMSGVTGEEVVVTVPVLVAP